ncbi:MAG: response regulator [Planctomycetaceae bacterium]|nr:response regulator [Planctomycetaceae bacterium]
MKTLLLVDDSRAVRLAGRRLAEAIGFAPLEAEDGAEALTLLRESDGVDVILLDWNMPVMDGLTFLRTLRADESLPQPIVVMCTTENDMSRVIEAISAGANEYIMKPFTEEIVREKLAQTGVL